VLSESTARTISRILVGVVERGTGVRAAIPGFTVAGKTGTAQKAGVGGYQPGRHVPNFAGFAPAEKARCVAVVVLEEPQGQYYAADVAAPLFASVMSQALGILRVAPREQRVPATELAELPAPPRRYPAGVVPVSSRGAERAEAGDRAPDLVGLTARQAVAVLARMGVVARLQGSGLVLAQHPPAGSAVRPGEVVTLFLAQDAAAPALPAARRPENVPPSPAP
jgi:membrane peptidoglycan carboxypeptidase